MSTPNKYGPPVTSRARWLRRYDTGGRPARVAAVRRLLGVDEVAAAAFLDAWKGEPSPVHKPPLFRVAFNAMPKEALAEGLDRAYRAAAKAQRRAQRAAGVRP